MNNLFSRLTPINNEYPTCDETEATLAIYDIDPDLITQKLNIKPTYNQKQGVPKVKRTGVSRIANRSSWLYSTEESKVLSKDLRVHLNWLLDAIERIQYTRIIVKKHQNS